MDGLFVKHLPDLGPCGLYGASIPCLTTVCGPKSARLRKEVRELCPGKPGVYGMVDVSGELIYVGKAKNLRLRLLSYFCRRSRAPKAGKILAQAASIVWEVGSSEFAALHRELELIRRWRPRWNVQGQPLRGRLTYLCVGRRPAPYVFLSRKPPRNTLAVHGPLPGGPRAQDAVRRLNDLFRLRDRPQAQEMVFPEQGALFPLVHPAGCLRYEIATCLGPCTGTCSQDDYGRQVKAVREFLAGHDLTPLAKIETDMGAAAQTQNFELAAILRDRLETLNWLTQRLTLLRHCREKMSFVYVVRGWDHSSWWYLIHAGRALLALPEPNDPTSARAAVTTIEAIYQGKKLGLLLDSYEHVDSMFLVASWFRKYPDEKKKALTPDEAIKICRR